MSVKKFCGVVDAGSARGQDADILDGPHDELIGERALGDGLTDGYAYALALEAECLAVMRSITAAAKRGSDGSEVGQMALRLGALRAEIAELRARVDERRRTIDPTGQRY